MLVVASVILAIALPAVGRATNQLHRRTTTDICANINGLLEVPEKFAGTVPVGFIDQCLCLSQIPSMLTSNAVAIAAVVDSSQSAASSALTNMVNTAADHTSCLFPDQAESDCSSTNLCGFKCTNGFVPFPPFPLIPLECICPVPNTVCNGVCGLFKACPSGKPKKRELNMQERRSLCRAGLTACGVYGFSSADAWECIDTKSDLESCGGCTVPFGRSLALGTDCTAIPGVMDVACVAGSCAVQRCQPGLVVAPNGSACMPASPILVEGEVPAAAYGLEHVPLKKKAN